ncbi:hypothetical protein CYANOKiyG1_11410 [Okeania sp. KiyG1]|nr:hypothetical protein CYANOKiyG1_11410 [Okeania sp. KiyG1]
MLTKRGNAHSCEATGNRGNKKLFAQHLRWNNIEPLSGIYLKIEEEMGGWGMGRWGDGEMGVFFYLQGKLPGVLLGDAGSHPLASPILVPEFPLARSD